MSGRSAPNAALVQAASASAPWWRRAWFTWLVGLLVAVLLILFPLVGIPGASLEVDKFWDLNIAKIAVFAVACLGLNIVMGYAGQVSLGQAFFVGTGAYAGAWVVKTGWGQDLGFLGFVVAFALAIVLPGAIGLLVALAAARLRGLAIAMVTIALPLVGGPLAKRFSDVTGGAQGEPVRHFGAPEWSGLADDQWQYYCCVVIAAGIFALTFFLVRGKYGRAFAVVKSNEAVAGAMGVSPYRTKVLAMTIAAMIGGAAGFLYLIPNQYTSPDTMSFGHSIELVIASIVGGSGTIVGAVIGGVYYILLPVLVNVINPNAHDIVEGIIILLALFLLPGGLTSLPRVIRRLARRGRAGHSVGAGTAAGPATETTEK